MRLIGMLDSPYVRRVAICLEFLGIPFEHEALSVFGAFDKFQSINPVVKAPTLVCDDGEVLMESSLILQFMEVTKSSDQSLWPSNPGERQHDFRALSLALAACEKSIQIVYERNLRPKEMHYEPWLTRVTGQLLAAYKALEYEIQNRQSSFSDSVTHASIAAAIAWQFTQSMLNTVVLVSNHPGLADLSVRLELTPEFRKYPAIGPGI